MFALNCAVIFLFFISFINAEISQCENNTKYKKLIKVKTKDDEIVDGRIRPIYGVFEDYNEGNHEIIIELKGEYLMLKSYGIEEIQPGAFKNVRGTIDLFLNQNKIKTIKNGIFNNNEGISVIDLTDNEISFIEDGAFDNIPRLLKIRLANNKLKTWNKNWFANTPKLTILSFQNNFMEELPAYAFKNLGGLKIIADDVFGLNLFFNGNSINLIHPKAFHGIYSLTYLQLSNNSLKDFSSLLLNCVTVKEIDLTGNHLTCIPKSSAYTEKTKVQPPLC